MEPLYTVAEIRDLESRAFHETPSPPLMARAGLAAAALARDLAGGGRSILVLAGPGNNGGDAFEAAAHLKRWFYDVDVVFTGDPARLSEDARAAFAKWNETDGRLLQLVPRVTAYDLVIDGLFGIGLQRAIEGRPAELIASANALPARRLALDIPSGLDADTGAVHGTAFRATHTVTFIAGKPGLYTRDGPDHCGKVSVATLGLETETLLPASGRLVNAALLEAPLLARPRNFHKGLAGSLAIVGGARGMVGAALLAGRAALRLGAGKVFLGLVAEDAPLVDPLQPELMIRPPDVLLADVPLSAAAIGPGLGTDTTAQRLLAHALRLETPIVIDADGLNLIAAYSVLQSGLGSRKAPTVITPHPAEAARLLGTDVKAVQADRLRAAQLLASRYGCRVALKGNGTVMASPGGRWWINTSGNPGMASAGTGDVLTGIIGSLLAQGLAAEQALIAGVYLHGAAADALAARGDGPIGLTAGELINPARALLNRGPANS